MGYAMEGVDTALDVDDGLKLLLERQAKRPVSER
jgi:hypothetical protein